METMCCRVADHRDGLPMILPGDAASLPLARIVSAGTDKAWPKGTAEATRA